MSILILFWHCFLCCCQICFFWQIKITNWPQRFLPFTWSIWKWDFLQLFVFPYFRCNLFLFHKIIWQKLGFFIPTLLHIPRIGRWWNPILSMQICIILNANFLLQMLSLCLFIGWQWVVSTDYLGYRADGRQRLLLEAANALSMKTLIFQHTFNVLL